MKRPMLFLCTMLLSQQAWAKPSAAIDAVGHNTVQTLATSNAGDVALKADEGLNVAQALWTKYQQEQAQVQERKNEQTTRELHYRGKTMRYSLEKIGSRPVGGYPLYIALHGGGSAPASLNNSQWEDMKRYYRGSVSEGVYIAPRAVNDSWDLHSQAESYVLYDRMIENALVFDDVNPNRVYVLGFSAGGDGTYQIAPKMADRFAAANMSAGHPNSIDITNLFAVPFLMQVGEVDGAYNRNRVVAEYDAKFQDLRNANPGNYVHEAFIHFSKPHNFYDNDPRQTPQTVLADPAKWLSQRDRTTMQRNTNAIAWLKQYVRNPIPERVIWDLKTRADRSAVDLWDNRHGDQHYWLDIGPHTRDTLGTDQIVASYDTAQNSIHVEKASTYLKLLLSGDMLDLSKPIHLTVGSQSWDVTVKPNLKNQVTTLLQRGDPAYMFEASIVLNQTNGSWTYTL